MNLRIDVFGVIIERFDKLNNKVIEISNIVDYLSQNECVKFYALILHNKDVDELGELVHEHYHLVIQLENKITKNTLINDICKYLNCNKNIISAMPGQLVPLVKYLTHMEYSKDEKYIYCIDDLVTNDETSLHEILLRGVNPYVDSVEYFINIALISTSLVDFYKRVGINRAKNYRSILLDIWNETKGKGR